MSTSATIKPITYRAELARKLIHLGSVCVPIGIWYTPWFLAVSILTLLTAICIYLDYVREGGSWAGQLLNGSVGFMVRAHERAVDRKGSPLTGASYLLIAALAVTILFPKPIAVAALVILIFGDAAAAIVGRAIGRTRLGRTGKSLEGSLAFVAVSLAAVSFVPTLPLIVGAIGAVAGATTEALPLRLDDNLTIPILAGFAMAITMIVF